MPRLKHALTALFLVFTFTLFCTTSNDFTQDLGRHLKLGEIIVTTRHIPATNLFSYTNAHFPFFNHHWLSEVIFYLITTTTGATSLNILKILILGGAAVFALKSAMQKATAKLAIISATLFTPLLLERADIRPEIFGFFFFSALLYFFSHEHLRKNYWVIAPLIFFLWVNLHISFIFGGFLLFIFTIQKLVKYKLDFFRKRNDRFITLTSLLALLINPHFITGALYPFFIFQNYGYAIVENQNLFFLNSIGTSPIITYYFILSPLVILTLILLLIRKLYWEICTLLVLYLLSFYQIRHLPFFALAAIPLVSQAFAGFDYKKYVPQQYVPYLYSILTMILLFLSFVNTSSWFYKTFDRDKQFGLTVTDPYKQLTDFIITNKLPNNIFNNFDIGGYLIYRLYPDYKVFVDNRPEAYPAVFFQQTYIPLQLYEKERKKVFTKNAIKTVMMAHTDQTDWGRSMIASLYKDSEWSLVFIDEHSIIFTKNTRIPDIRGSNNYLNDLVLKQNNYLSLLHLWQFFSLVGNHEMGEKAVQKAIALNPSSCAINRIVVSYLTHSPQFDEAENIRKSKWYCF